MAITSCRYSTPLIKYDKKEFSRKDPETKSMIKGASYYYLRLSRYGFKGGYSYTKTYNEDGILISIVKSKSSHASVRDGYAKYSKKSIFYNPKGYISQVHYEVTLYKSRSGSIQRVNKSDMFDENGKKVETKKL